MNCPNCDEIMEREDSLAGRREFYKPEALYQCENCGLQGRWALRERFQITYDPRDEFLFPVLTVGGYYSNLDDEDNNGV